ncbi:endonuclease/exonuclease/phosphatase family domain-containing protein 1-like [Pseudophryne corroboree]|uniref:endonuclease/exonuclease/phosphatase family domain-containing protein 1-like n=1 Tax=Pseudophryne corroboree TaxID=495146 RepID=UPI003081F2CC
MNEFETYRHKIKGGVVFASGEEPKDTLVGVNTAVFVSLKRVPWTIGKLRRIIYYQISTKDCIISFLEYERNVILNIICRPAVSSCWLLIMGSAVSCRTGRRRNQRKSLSSAPPESCLDINLATEEELMTLPGVTRSLAQNITAHRRKIHGFRRVEDLALVSGVGAERMLELRPEIWVERNALCGESNGAGTVPGDTPEDGTSKEQSS